MNYLLNEENKQEGLRFFKSAVEIGTEFKLQQFFREKHFSQGEIGELFKMPVESKELEEVIKNFKEDILPYCSNFGSQNFMGFPDSGNSLAAITGNIFADFLQQNLINSTFCAPIATFIEIAVIKWLREIVGFSIIPINNVWDVGGIITGGGTTSNTIALLMARENKNSNTMVDGVKDPRDYKVIIPKDIGHYSIKSGQMWIGCGENVIEVPTKDFKYDLFELEKVLKENKGKIMCVVAYVGDSRTMTIENLTAVNDLVKSIDDKIWLHADACHGFSLGFSEELKYKIKGIELFDSISTDPHKVLMTPYTISALLIKNPESLKKVTTTSDLIMQEEYAFGQVTPFIGSKSWISLKLWFLFQNLGMKEIGNIINRRCEMAIYLKNTLESTSEFVILNDVDINSVVFMYVGKSQEYKNDIEKLNLINKKMYKKILEEGKYYLHQFSIPDNKGIIKKDAILYPLRYMSGNDNITKDDIHQMLSYLLDMEKEEFL